MGPIDLLEIRESEQGAWVYLRVRGELDLATAPILEQRIEEKRAAGRAVRLDLSALCFMDSTGIQLLVKVVGEARANGWRLEIYPDLSPAVARVIQLANVGPILFGSNARHTATSRTL
jgi:anti-anti-sigma factor